MFCCHDGKKSRARLASPQPRPASPVNGAGGITGCGDDAQVQKSFQPGSAFFEFFLKRGGAATKPWGLSGVDRPPQVTGTAQDKKCHG